MNIMPAVNQYQIYCNAESKFVRGWGETAPTTCYNNNTHSVNLNSIQVVQTVASDIVTINEDQIKIPRNVWVKDIVFTNIQSQESQHQYYTTKFPVSIYSFTIVSDDTNRGDQISIVTNPDTPLGLITADVKSGDTTISAPPGLLYYASIGFNIKITDGVNINDLGKILSINVANGTAVLEFAATNSFSATNSVLLMSYYIMDNLTLGAPGVTKWGDDAIGGSSPPLNTITKFTYKNNTQPGELTDTPKTFVLYFTILF